MCGFVCVGGGVCVCVCTDSCVCVCAVPELLARGVVQQVFPLHDERVLALLMTSWVQAVCDSQPLGKSQVTVHRSQEQV